VVTGWNERPNAPPPNTDVCALADVTDGAARVVAFGRQDLELIVVRDSDGIRGFVNECPHNPLPLNIGSRIYTENNRLHCDHHYAVFQFSDGRCTAGVCVGQALAPVPLDVVGDRVVIASIERP